MNVLARSMLRSQLTTVCRFARARYSVNTGSKEFIDGLVKKEKLVVFMKGTPDAPMCGFSKAVVQILNIHGVDNISAHNCLDDELLRQGIKEYSNWPTIPQVYMGGEFIGGCDIMLDLHKSGELIEELQKIGIESALEKADSKES